MSLHPLKSLSKKLCLHKWPRRIKTHRAKIAIITIILGSLLALTGYRNMIEFGGIAAAMGAGLLGYLLVAD